MITTLEKIDENQLFIDNEKLIYKTIHEMHLEIDKYYDIALIGFTKGLKTFSQEKSKLSTYLCVCIKNEILQEIRKNRFKGRNVPVISINKTLDVKDGNLTIEDRIKDERIDIESEIQQKELRDLLEVEIGRLKPKEQFVINHLFGMNGCHVYKQIEIAKLLNVAQTTVSRLKRTGIKKLRERFEKYGY